MSAPYTVKWGWCLEHESGPYDTLEEAIRACNKQQEQPWSWMAPTVHGDGYDLDCADGLTREERDRVIEECH